MNLVEFVKALKLLGYPVAFSHFDPVDGQSVPAPPFITYLTPGMDNFVADDRVYHKITNLDIELYTRNKDLEAEQAIEDLLDELELPYDATQVWIESEKLHQKTYETRLI